MAYSQQNNPFMKRGTSYSPLKDNGDEEKKGRTPKQIERYAKRHNLGIHKKIPLTEAEKKNRRQRWKEIGTTIATMLPFIHLSKKTEQ